MMGSDDDAARGARGNHCGKNTISIILHMMEQTNKLNPIMAPGPRNATASWILTFAVSFQLVAFFSQFYFVLKWEKAVELGLMEQQRESHLDDDDDDDDRDVIVDCIVYLPLCLVSLLYRDSKNAFGFAVTLLALGFGVYWPLSAAFRGHWDESQFPIYWSELFFGLSSGVGLVALLMNYREYLDFAANKEKES